MAEKKERRDEERGEENHGAEEIFVKRSAEETVVKRDAEYINAAQDVNAGAKLSKYIDIIFRYNKSLLSLVILI